MVGRGGLEYNELFGSTTWMSAVELRYNVTFAAQFCHFACSRDAF